LTSTSTAPACSTRWSSWAGSLTSETSLAALGGDRIDYRGATVVVPSVHDDLGAVPAEFFGRCPADARSGPGNQGNDVLEVPLFVHPWDIHLGSPSPSCLVAILRSKAAAGVSVT
jgi:hypothetical protein